MREEEWTVGGTKRIKVKKTGGRTEATRCERMSANPQNMEQKKRQEETDGGRNGEEVREAMKDSKQPTSK